MADLLYATPHGQVLSDSPLNFANDILGVIAGRLGASDMRLDSRGDQLFLNVKGLPAGFINAINGNPTDPVAMTVGHAIISTGSFDLSTPQGAWWYAHEDALVLQSQILGPLYLPIYGLAAAAAGGRHDGNFMERMANEYADKYWREYWTGGAATP